MQLINAIVIMKILIDTWVYVFILGYDRYNIFVKIANKVENIYVSQSVQYQRDITQVPSLTLSLHL